MRHSTVLLNKPILHGVPVLARAKAPMYKWHYEYMIPKYGDKAKLCYTDTDSLIYEIETEDYYDDIRTDVSKRFDTSAYPEDPPSGLPILNRKAPGMMKDEACGRNIVKGVFLGPKQYALKLKDYDEDKKCNAIYREAKARKAKERQEQCESKFPPTCYLFPWSLSVLEHLVGIVIGKKNNQNNQNKKNYQNKKTLTKYRD